jgi:hypothetical protein
MSKSERRLVVRSMLLEVNDLSNGSSTAERIVIPRYSEGSRQISRSTSK